MKIRALYLALLAALPLQGAVEVDVEAFGQSLGGWKAKKGKAAEYEVSDASYRTYQPEISPSPDGGIFVSVRIDHRRGFMSADDHASLELSFGPDGSLVSAQSSLALQGRTITSELIKSGASATTSVVAPGVDRAVKVGTDLVADLSAKMLREKIVEPGRVSFPAAIRHNYNLLYQAVRRKKKEPEAPTVAPGGGVPLTPEGPDSPLVRSSSKTPPPSPPATTPAGTAPSVTPPASAPASGSTPAAPGPAPANSPTPPAANPPTQTATPAAPSSASASAPTPATPAAAPGTPPTAATETAKKEPDLQIKPYNGTGVSTPVPPKKEQSLLREYGDDVLKIARDAVKNEVK